tara:strand:+ start:1385 stop:1933 length:549 start_codon:yes stop_codon:yes gene_type:complete
MKKRKNIPKKLRKEVWLKYMGKVYEGKCYVNQKGGPCTNIINVLGDWHCGHNIAHKYGGRTVVKNLRPICSECNIGMSSISIEDWCEEYGGVDTTKENLAIQSLLKLSKSGKKNSNEALRFESSPRTVSNKFWEVEKIVQYDDLQKLYEIKWMGWPDRFNTWEPVSHFNSVLLDHVNKQFSK